MISKPVRRSPEESRTADESRGDETVEACVQELLPAIGAL
jgi:hypothetical protein